MTTQTNTEASRLRAELERHNWLYHAEHKPEISDAEYDRMVIRLHRLEHGEEADSIPISPFRVGAPDTHLYGNKVEHDVQMLSLDNVFDRDQFAVWYQRTLKAASDSVRLTAELKYDGLAVCLIYQDGKLDTAATRGNGHIGEDVTLNALRITDIPKYLTEFVPGTLTIHGEVYMRRSAFAAVNRQKEAAGDALFVSPRNAAAGSLRNSDPDETARRPLSFFAYLLADASDMEMPQSHGEALARMGDLGLPVNNNTRLDILDFDSAFTAFEEMRAILPELDYDNDGIVFKVDDVATRQRIGSGSHTPRWAIAFKLPAQQARSRLLAVDFTVGFTGSINPLARIEPVRVGGVLIENLTLHNRNFIEEKGLMMGDQILIERAGDVIPALVQCFPEERDGTEEPILYPRECPACGAQVRQPIDSTRTYCVNPSCEGQSMRLLERFVERDFMNMEGIGAKQINQLIEAGLLLDPSGFYRLTKDDLLQLDRVGDRKAQNILDVIERSKEQPLNRVLASLGIREIGRTASMVIAEEYKTMDRAVGLTKAELVGLSGFGVIMANLFVEYMANEDNLALIERLRSAGVNMIQPTLEPAESAGGVASLTGLSICATGALQNYSRNEIKERIVSLGGKAQSSVSAKTDFLLAGEKAGSKVKKATQMGIRVISEEEFEALCASGSV